MKNQAQLVSRVRNPPTLRPLMVFDGDCKFCRFWIERWRTLTLHRVDYEPYQSVSSEFPELPHEAFEREVQLIEPDGRLWSGADAVFRLLEYTSWGRWPVNVLKGMPGFTALARIAYRFIAQHRTFFSLITRVFLGRSADRPTYLVARWIFVRLIGIVYLIAFSSLLLQIRGLIGKRGISPAADFLRAVRDQTGSERYWLLPTICWADSSDCFLVSLCVAGIALSIGVVCGFLPSLCLLFLWAIYLSLIAVGEPFMSFQWDALLLQVGFLTLFLVPPGVWPDWKRESGGSRIFRWLLLGLLFCLMVESGIVKLSSRDESWKSLTALAYHYETQPLPLWTSWYLNQTALWFETLSVMYMFAMELIVPFSVFGPRNVRRIGSASMIFFQLLIFATGNYCFFNLLTIALCILLIDDDVWPRWCRERLMHGTRAGGIRWSPWIIAPVAAVDLVISLMQFAGALRWRVSWPAPLTAIYEKIAPFRTFNGYGLFAIMTTSRQEIVVEGSNDGENWLSYEFKWKPGDVNHRPGLVAPYQPRLDWQMWFAALGNYRQNPWFMGFLERLLEGSPDVLALLASNPFPAAPPRYIRGTLYDYKFTRFGDHTQAWWERVYRGPYCPVLSLQNSGGTTSPD